jgi:hypothetical protein
MGYLIVIVLAVVLIPLVLIVSRRSTGRGVRGEEGVGKPVMATEPAADEPTPDASSVREDTAKAQSRTPAA